VDEVRTAPESTDYFSIGVDTPAKYRTFENPKNKTFETQRKGGSGGIRMGCL
jgi:hypothetical protein